MDFTAQQLAQCPPVPFLRLPAHDIKQQLINTSIFFENNN